MPESFHVGARMRSVKYAVAGILEMLRGQHNARVHLVASVGVVLAGLLVGVTRLEWCILVLAMASVWVSEALNTAVEFLCDVASPDFHPLVKKSKDVAAGAVLLSAIGAAVIGLLVFVPYLLVYV